MEQVLEGPRWTGQRPLQLAWYSKTYLNVEKAFYTARTATLKCRRRACLEIRRLRVRGM